MAAASRGAGAAQALLAEPEDSRLLGLPYGVHAGLLPPRRDSLPGPTAHEIAVHKAVKLSRDRSFSASGSFVHFSHHALHDAASGRTYIEAGSVRSLRRKSWYDTPKAARLRKCLRSRCFSALALVALFVALFFPDLFVLLQVPTNRELDGVLVTAFVLFAVEIAGLMAAEEAYPLSFFWLMDLIGTFSMSFDISFALGPDASLPERYTEKTQSDNAFVIVRAARAARLGARAGRLSRVVKILRFLSSEEDPEHSVKMAKVISNKLSDVLSVRVAFLVICIAVILPSFQMFEYPEMDESMIAWTQMLVPDINNYYSALEGAAGVGESKAVELARSRVTRELRRFAGFYSRCPYGPFKVCKGRDVGDGFECLERGGELHMPSNFTAPARRASILEINKADVQVFYDMSTPRRMEAAMNIGMICFIILVMVAFSMVLSSNISVIALAPLERMLSVVRQRCKQIFKYTHDLQEEPGDRQQDQMDEEEYHANRSSEFALLEKAVSKLVAIAALSARTSPVDDEVMDEHRNIVMGWMQGGQQPSRSLRSGIDVTAKPLGLCSKSTMRLTFESTAGEEGSRILKQAKSLPQRLKMSLMTPDFDALSPNRHHQVDLGAYIIYTSEGSADYIQSIVPDEVLLAFMAQAEKLYPANPFHNFGHALDVLHSVAYAMQLTDAYAFLSEAEQFWIMIAAVGHDLGHGGLTNQFLVETAHELAVTYNDRSPLENMHCSKLFQIVSEPEANVFQEVERQEYKDMRKGIINAILHTDITKHSEMVKELSLLYQMHPQAFGSPDAPDAAERCAEVLGEHSQMVINTFLHVSDIGNSMKPWELCYKWAQLVLDEFFAQGDREKELGIPVQMLHDREKVNRPNSQIGWCEFMLMPLVEAMVPLCPALDTLAHHLGKNVRRWAAMWVEESSPPEDQVEKVRVRVQKVVAKCEALQRPGGEQETESEDAL